MKLQCKGERITADIDERELLSGFHRHELRMTGAMLHATWGVCGACAIIVGDEATRSCLMSAAHTEGLRVRTAERLADREILNQLQSAFQQHHTSDAD
jgi:nicotinate dehydrogenase subunit A